MNRPDLDDIEANIRGGDFPGARESRANWSALVLRLIAYARHLEARISELEVALEPYVTHAHSNAARVLRKGE